MPVIITPIIHNNGTSATELKELREKVYSALEDVATAMRQMAPNGRDYYLVPGMMEQATAQHMRRLGAIRDIQDELEKECKEIDKQFDNRR